jgi:hypothetical protein
VFTYYGKEPILDYFCAVQGNLSVCRVILKKFRVPRNDPGSLLQNTVTVFFIFKYKNKCMTQIVITNTMMYGYT